MEVVLLFGKVVSVFLSVILVFSFSVSSLAAPATPSDSLMDGRLPVASGADASELDASFSVDPVPYSSLGSVENTVNYDGVRLYADFYDSSQVFAGSTSVLVDSSGHANFIVPTNASYMNFGIELEEKALPSSGIYSFTVDFASDFSVNYDTDSGMQIHSDKSYRNAGSQREKSSYVYPLKTNSGDWQSSGTVNIGSGLNWIVFMISFSKTDNGLHPGEPFGGYAKVNLKYNPSAQPDSTTVGAGDATQDFQSGVTDIMGSISDTLVEIVSTISDQLEALWDQMYNYMHLEQLANDDKNTGQIVDAINSQGSQVSQDIIDSQDENAQDIMDNQDSNFDNLENGYDNSGMASDNEKLDGAINDYDSLEDSVIEQVEGNINDFQFDNPFESFTAPMEDIGYFLTGIYNALGALNIPIGFSLTLSIALLAIGWYRFKGGA